MKDYAKLYDSKGDSPTDMKVRLKELEDLVDVNSMQASQANWIVKLRRPSGQSSSPNASRPSTIEASNDPSSNKCQSAIDSTPDVPRVKVIFAHVDHPHSFFVHLDVQKVKTIQQQVRPSKSELDVLVS